jgi:hypothetical protein
MPDEYKALVKQMEKLKNYGEGWDVYEADPPSNMAIECAKKIMRRMKTRYSRLPEKITPLSEGGICLAIYTCAPRGYCVDIDCYNDGQCLASFRWGSSDRPEMWCFYLHRMNRALDTLLSEADRMKQDHETRSSRRSR